jgi:CDP-glucose 4,6-dehydratase
LEGLVMFNNVYKDKKVLITGHTGFKGSWLTTWLLKLGANIVGVSKDIPTTPAMFNELGLEGKIKHYQEDIRNIEAMLSIVAEEKPDFLFHLAAQPIVSTSYEEPLDTISSNVMGTANVLEALKSSNQQCVAIIITIKHMIMLSRFGVIKKTIKWVGKISTVAVKVLLNLSLSHISIPSLSVKIQM